MLLALGAFGLTFLVRGNQKKTGDERKCDNIKELLEQKKKELEEMIKAWPEEKLKVLAMDAALTQAKKDPAARVSIEAGQRAHKEITSLKKTIEMLQSRFDLCMLSIHVPGTGEYEGTLAENSLVDAAVLEHIRVTGTHVHDAMSVKKVSVSEKQIEKLERQLVDGPWHMRFQRNGTDEGLIVFKDKRFPISFFDSTTWRAAAAHGRALGIREELLDFSKAL